MGSSNSDIITSGENRSYWISSVEPIVFKKLENNIDTDILVVGGGIAGLTTAYCVLKAGKKVVLIEDGYIGSGESGRTSAHLSCALDDGFAEIQKTFGQSKAALAAGSHKSAIQFIENIVRDENIDCNFRRIPGYLFPGEGDDIATLEEEFRATRDAGLETEMLDEVPGINLLEKSSCILFPDQGQFHPMRYLQGLANAVSAMGGIIYTETRAEEIHKNSVMANGFIINANHIVVATNTPVNDLVTMHTKQYPYRTYIIAAKIQRGILPYALWWDTGYQNSKWVKNPYHYIRLEEYSEKYDLLIAGGEDHRVGQADDEDVPEEDRYINLYQWTKSKFPAIEDVVYRWSGQIMEPLDYMAFIGRNPGDDNIYIVTGDSGNGLTHGTIAGILLRDLITGKENPWVELYDPSRFPLKKPGDFLKEAGNMAVQYADWISKGDIEGVEELNPGEGGILSSGLKKYAVFRDEEGQLHTFSAICPHLAGILTWNNDEKSFDCPVHGSRFTTEGKVINGPAISDLKKLVIGSHSKVNR